MYIGHGNVFVMLLYHNVKYFMVTSNITLWKCNYVMITHNYSVLHHHDVIASQ